jgi:HYR domain/Secretion system C-terminal sorting domain
MRKLYKLILPLFVFFFSFQNVKAQTTLAAGDLAFSGYISAGNGTTISDRFSFVLLAPVTANTVIKFTDYGWRTDLLAFSSGATLESEYTLTISGALPAGTEIQITTNNITGNPTPTATLVGGASAGTVVVSVGASFLVGNMSLNNTGDQLFAYQGTFSSPVFISGIHKNAYSTLGGDPSTTTTGSWDGVIASGSLNGTSSSLPAGLTNGTNALWIGIVNPVPPPFTTEWDNAFFACGPDVSTATLARAALNNQANWTKTDGAPAFTLPTGCNYLGVLSAPTINTNPSNSSVCEGANTSFSITATGAISYQWQVDNGGGFTNITNNATYTGTTTATLNITATPASFNGYIYRCVATNGTGSVNSTGATLTVTALPVAPTLLAKTPNTATVADGTPVSATFNAGSGGTGCSDDYRYTTNGGGSYLPYTPGSNISTTGLAASGGIIQIEGRRANCSAGCQGIYTVLASWIVTPLPAGASTLIAGDIAFSGYASDYPTVPEDNFSFVLLRNVGPGTIINFTDNGWLSTNVFRTGEQTVTWTAPAGGLPAGTEIKITDLTATRSGGGSAGSVTGAAGLQLSTSGDQIIAYQGSAATPTFISAIHMNLNTTLLGDPVSTTSAAWDGTANNINSSALPTGLTTGVNCIWIGTQDVPASEFENSRYGNCAAAGVAGPVSALRALLNNQANWISDNNQPPSFTLPTGCNYLNALVPTISVTGTPLAAFTACQGTSSAEQNFSVSGSALTANIIITAPAGFEVSITSGSGFNSSVTLTQSGGTVPATTIYVRTTAAATGTPSGDITLASTGATTINVAVTATVNPLPPTPTITAGGPTTFCAGGSVTLTSSSATGNLWSTGETTQSIVVTTAGTYTVTVTSAGCTSAPSAGTTITVNPLPATPTITPGGPTTFCTGGSVTLTSSSATGNLWSTGETTQSIVVTTGGTYTVTVTSGGCTSAPSAGTTVTVDPLPTTSNAGPDGTACVSPGSFTMAANVPAVGTGVWSQAPGGPSTAIIFTPGSATSNIGGLTSTGVYTFVWSISSGSCPVSRDTMTITVNTNPVPFTLAGGGTFCPGSTTLTGPVDPNYTYTWQRSLSGIANPNSFTNIGGTGQTQAVTISGSYRLIVTNQFGCSASDTAAVSMADYVFNGSLATGDAVQTGRINRFAVVSTCAAPKACPGTFTTTGSRLYDAYTVTNPRNVPVCATIGIASGCGVNMFSVAYTGSYDPNALCTNYLADPGSSFPNVGYYEATIPANSSIVVIVHEVNVGAGCANYQLTVDVPREAGITVNPSTPICSGAPVTLTAPVANSYSWNPGGNTTQAITVSPTATTEYFVTTTYGNNGCTGLDSATVVVQSLPTTAFAGNDTATCGLTINNLAANTPVVGTGTWTLVTGPGTINFGNANAPNSSATASVTGVYTLRWTIATGAPCINSSQDDILLNFAASPSAAIAGTDKTACVSPGSATMTATAPTIGTGVWTQVAGPSTAVIVNATSPTTNILNLAGIGTYTFRWTVTNAPCPPVFDDVDVVVNGNPVPFILAGGGTFCPGTTTLTAPVNPNYTYTWERSLSGIANPNSFTAFGGTAQTQDVTISGNYRVIVTNQFGCIASDTASVSMADYVFNGSLASGDLTQNGRVNRFGVVSTCAAPKTCPGIFTATGARLYDAYTITNPRNVPVCATIGIASGCGVNMFSVAYTGSYDPNSLCTNYLADPGSSFPNVGYYEATIPANGSIVVIVHEVNTGTGCANYQLTVDVPRDLSPIIANPPSVVCNGTSTLTAPVANSYLWSPGGQTTRSIVTPPLFVPTQFNVTLGYGNNGCNREDSVTVGVTSLPPTITCPANITLSNTTGQCGRTVTYTPTVGGLPTPTETYTFTGATTGAGAGNGSGSFFNIGTTTVEITVTNPCGTTSCTFTVTINDTENPTITCPAPVTVDCPGDVPTPNTGSVTASDNCPGYVVSFRGDVISGQTCLSRYTITRTYRVTDASGNFVECTQTIVVNDQTAPVITCPAPVTVTCAADVPTPNILGVTATDNCGSLGGPVTITWQGDVISAQTCANRYTITRTYRATDDCGNFAECTQIITVDDQTPPVLTCPAPVTVSCASAVPVPDIASVTGVSDNCAGVVTVTHQGDVISGQTCANRYTITRTYRATDVCGNFTECTQIITVNDQTPPVMTCPAPVTVSCASAVPVPDIASVTGVSDNCAGVVTVTHQGDVISGQTCANRYTITRTYRATDVCGNFTECTQIITVNDQTPPTMTCPAPVTVSCASAVPVPNIASVTGVSDNCAGVVTVTHQGDVISGQTCANRYTITRTYRATDVCGNFTECTQIITVNDQTPPVITCPAPVTVSCASAVPAPNTTLVTATDNCAGVITITHISDVISNQTCTNRYTITRTYRATDVCGNFAQCTQIITVNDQTAPVITCPANITVTTPVGSCTAVVNFSVTATDNCNGPVTIVSSPASGSVFSIGTTTVTSTATDACGNSSTCTFTVTVLDAQLPVITAQPANRTVCTGSNATFSVTAATSPSAGGPIAYQWQQWNGSAWTNISGATASTYTVNNTTVSMNTNSFRVILTGLCTVVTSNHATLYVNSLPSIGLTASPTTSLLPTQTTTITATTNPSGGTFVWTLNGSPISGVTGPVVGPLTVSDAGTYRAVYTDPRGCVSTSADIVISAQRSNNLWVFPNPNTGQFNVRFYNQTGENATLKVFNGLGQVVYTTSLPLGIAYSNISVNLGNIPAGVYIVKIMNGTGAELAAKRIIVNHP